MRRRLSEISFVAALLALLVSGGCVGTPQPDPPNLQVTIDPELVFAAPANWGGVTVLGQPGAIEPTGAILRFFDLDNADPFHDVVPDDEGGFLAEVPGLYGDEFRLQAIFEGQRSTPLDVLVPDFETLLPASRPLLGCLTAAPPLWATVVAGGSIEVTLTNDCGEAVLLGEVAPRLDPNPFFTVVDPPAAIAPGASEVVTVELSRDGAGAEEVLRVEVSAPEVDRRPITLVGVEP